MYIAATWRSNPSGDTCPLLQLAGRPVHILPLKHQRVDALAILGAEECATFHLCVGLGGARPRKDRRRSESVVDDRERERVVPVIVTKKKVDVVRPGLGLVQNEVGRLGLALLLVVLALVYVACVYEVPWSC